MLMEFSQPNKSLFPFDFQYVRWITCTFLLRRLPIVILQLDGPMPLRVILLIALFLAKQGLYSRSGKDVSPPNLVKLRSREIVLWWSHRFEI